MKCIAISHPGGPEVLRLVERPDPVPAHGEVLVRVRAAGVNRPDAMQRLGKYPPPAGTTDIPGLEIAGTVASAPGGSRWKAGDEVCALVAGGGYAELCVAPEPQCLPIPGGLSMTEAAAVPETFFTVWSNVFERGRLGRGETLLVHGGTSGIGTTAIQLARSFGARAIATAGSDEKCAACVRIGAEGAINYRTEDFVERVRELTSGRGADVILDIVGGEYFGRNIEALALEGRLVLIGLMGGARAEVNLVPVLQRRLTITGSTLRARRVEEKGRLAREVEQHVWPLLASGAVKPVVHATFPLEAAAEAHRLLESSAHVGKLVLVV
ncbi:MAG TPA: NAD(P)H-quinone oxidoreductase [Vicinamibacterales bacterium]|nr:NAD(P)H-quinone oxidoreductase [Vicinamibacterales bacterium]